MRFSSLLSSQLGRNAIFYLIFISFHTLILSVTIVPNDKIIAVWSNQEHFITCQKDDSTPGTLKWYSPSGLPIDNKSKNRVYVKEDGDSVKLILVNVPKKQSGTYECRQTLSNGTVISSDKFELKVYNFVKIEHDEDSYLGIERDPFSMSCFAQFDSESTEATVAWSFNGSHINEKDELASTFTELL